MRCRRMAGTTGVTVVALMLLGAGCSSSSSPPRSAGGATTKVNTTLLLDWFPNPDHISLYTAQRDGDFAAQGLNVKFQSPSNATDALKLVSLGQVPMAISYEPNVITAATQGLDVTAVAAFIPTPLDTLIISGKSGVSSPAGLVGKSVATTGDPVANAIYGAQLKHLHVDASKTKLVAVSEGLIPAIVNGNVAAIIGGYRNVEAIQLQLKGFAPKVFPVEKDGVPNYDELVVVANTTKLKNDAGYRKTVQKFLAGLSKGDAAAQADPAAALAAITPAAKGYSTEELTKMVDATAPLLKNPAGFGAMSVTAWQSFADWMKSEGLINKPVDASAIVDTSLLP